METVLSAGPVHVPQRDGSFVPVDTGLKRVGRGWSPRSTAYEATLPERSDGVLRFGVEAGVLELEMLPVGAAEVPVGASAAETAAAGDPAGTDEAVPDGAAADEPAPVVGVVEDATLAFEDVAGASSGGGVDVTLTATPRGVKEDVILEDASSPRRFGWALSLTEGLSPSLTAENEVHVTDADGQVVMWMPAPFMTDASGDFDVRSTSFDVSLERQGSGWRYELVADDAWLDAPERQWPVTIDPTVTQGRYADCTLTSGTQADVNYCASEGMRTGRTASGWIRRTIVGFDTAYTFREFDISPANIMNAELSLAFTSDSGQRRSASVHRVSQAWNNGATWNRRSSGSRWATPGGSFQSSGIPSATWGTPYSSTTDDGVWGAKPGRLYWYPTQLVQQWVDGTVADHGILVKHVDETVAAEMRFHSGEAADFRNFPELKIQWTRGIGAQDRYTHVGDTSVTDRSQYSVNVGSGNLYLTANDLTLPGKDGHDLGVERAYNSLRRRGSGDHATTADEFIGDFGIG